MVVGGKTFCLAGLRRCMAGRQAGSMAAGFTRTRLHALTRRYPSCKASDKRAATESERTETNTLTTLPKTIWLNYFLPPRQ